MILVWSILLCCHVAAKNYAGILVLRFLLGMYVPHCYNVPAFREWVCFSFREEVLEHLLSQRSSDISKLPRLHLLFSIS